MPQVPFTAFYLGPTAVYPTNTGLQDPITGAPEKGGNFNVGDYCDLSTADANTWNQQYSTQLYQGRYRIVKVVTAATAANIFAGAPVAWALGTTVQNVSLSVAGSGGTNGTYICSSSTSGGTAKATVQVVVSGNAIISCQLLTGGVGFTSVPTFGLTEIPGIGGGASILAQMTESANVVCSYDSAAINLTEPRGLFLGAVTSTQVSNGAYVVIQEAGIGTVKVTTATNTAAGAYVAATTGAAITTTTAATAVPVGFMGTTLDLAAASTLIRMVLRIPILQG